MRKREYEGIAPFDNVPEEPELVAENVSELVEHQATSAYVSTTVCKMTLFDNDCLQNLLVLSFTKILVVDLQTLNLMEGCL